MRDIDKAVAAARAADDKKAEEVVILAVGPVIRICDYFVICSGATRQHMKAVVEGIEKALAKHKIKPLTREGMEGYQWVLLDYGDVVVHVFDREHRDYYQLERLWADAEKVDWRREGEAAAP